MSERGCMLLGGLRFDCATVRVGIAAARAGAGSVFEMRVKPLAYFLAAIRGADLLVEHWVPVVDAGTIGHLPVPAVRSVALGYEVHLLTSSTGHCDLARDEPRAFTHVLRISAGKQGSDVAVSSRVSVYRADQETEAGRLAYVGIPFSYHDLYSPLVGFRDVCLSVS